MPRVAPKHAWPKGVSGNPKGRPKGSNHNLTKLIRTAEEIASQFDLTPLEYLMSIVNNTKCGHTVRIDAAKAAAPYIHMKMPSRIDVQAPPGSVPGGVMLVPYFTSDKEWSLAASKSQEDLKKEVRGN